MTLSLQLGLYFLFIGMAIFVGALLPILRHSSPRPLPLFLSLSAGLMLGSGFIHLLPESFELIGKKASLFLLAGFLFLYIFERFITVHACEANSCEVHHHLGLSAFVGLCIHSLTDGVALAAGLLVPKLGVVVFIAIFIHKVLESFSLTSILMHEKKNMRSIILANGALFLSVPFGAVLTLLIFPTSHEFLAGAALSFAAGTFLHISLSDLLPEVHRHSSLRNKSFGLFSLGLILMGILSFYL